MKVKAITNIGTNDFPEAPFLEGEEHEVPDFLGEQLVKARLVLDITSSPNQSPPMQVVVSDADAPKPDKFQKIRADHTK